MEEQLRVKGKDIEELLQQIQEADNQTQVARNQLRFLEENSRKEQQKHLKTIAQLEEQLKEAMCLEAN